MSRSRVRRIMLVAVARVPFSALRVGLLRTFFGYDIGSGVRLGRRTVIDSPNVHIGARARIARNVRITVASLTLGDECIIGELVKATGPFAMSVGAGTSIQREVEFFAGDWADPASYALECVIGPGVAISPTHFFDVVAGLYIGEGTWFAGRGSQVWTHGFSRRGPVRVGSYCYVASAVRIAPRVSIASRTAVALASVVTKNVEQSGCLVAGVPARVLQSDYQPIVNWHAAND